MGLEKWGNITAHHFWAQPPPPQTGLDIRNDPVIPKMHLITAMSQPRRQPATSLRARLVPARQPQAEHSRVGGGGVGREADVVRDSSHAAVRGLHQLSFLALEKPGSVIFSTFPAQLISAGLHLSQQKYTHFQALKLVRIQARLDNSWKTMRGKKGSLISSPWQSLCVWLRRRIKGRQSVIFFAAWNHRHRNDFTFTFRQTPRLTKISQPRERLYLRQIKADTWKQLNTLRHTSNFKKARLRGKFQLH